MLSMRQEPPKPAASGSADRAPCSQSGWDLYNDTQQTEWR